MSVTNEMIELLCFFKFYRYCVRRTCRIFYTDSVLFRKTKQSFPTFGRWNCLISWKPWENLYLTKRSRKKSYVQNS